MLFLKNILLYFILASVLFQTVATLGIIMQFEANRKYYAEVLCINKNRPELACQGKCVLMKRLQNEFEQQQDTEKQTLKRILERDLTLFCVKVKMPDFYSRNFSNSINTRHQFHYNNIFHERLSTHEIFHPPAFV